MDPLTVLLTAIAPFVVSFVVTFLMSVLKKVVPVVGTLPAVGQQLIVAVIGVAGAWVATLLKLPLPIDLTTYPGAEVFLNGALTALAAMGIYALKPKEPAPPIPPPNPPRPPEPPKK